VAEIVDEDVVILGAAFAVGKDGIEDIQHGANLHLQAGFLSNLTGNAVAQLLSQVEAAAGNGPLALHRRVGAADKEHLSIAKNDGTDTYDRKRWVETRHKKQL
jgi:hypothetical protein